MRLRFWLRSAGECMLAILGGSVFYAAVLGIQLSGGWEASLQLLPFYLLLMGAVMQVALMLGMFKFQLPLALSFGSTRKEAWVGLHIYRLLPALAVSILASVLSAFSTEPASLPLPDITLLTLGVMILGSAIGTVMGLVYLRFGKIGTIITIVMLALVGGAGGAMAVLSPSIGRLAALLENGLLSWLVLLAGILCYGVILIPEGKVLRTYQVKL